MEYAEELAKRVAFGFDRRALAAVDKEAGQPRLPPE